MKRLHLDVLTIDSTVLEEDVDALVVPLADGWIGIKPGRAAFQARVMRGEVIFRCDDRERTIATLGGTIVVKADRVTILTGAALVDRDLPDLEREISDELATLQTMESEAEKHFDRVYRQMAETFRRRRRSYG